MNKNIITNDDIEIMKKFIDKYEQIENDNKKYLLICESVRKNSLFQKYNDEELDDYSMDEIYKLIEINELNKINKETNINRKKLLIEQLNELKKMIDYIQDYKAAEENYKQLHKIQDTENIDELPTKEYNRNEPLPQREYILNKNTTITQIYKRIKELYRSYLNKTDIFSDENLKTYIFYKQDILNYINKPKMETKINIEQNNNGQNRKIERIK